MDGIIKKLLSILHFKILTNYLLIPITRKGNICRDLLKPSLDTIMEHAIQNCLKLLFIK